MLRRWSWRRPILEENAVVDDREIARRVLDEQARARNYPMCEVTASIGWSKRKLAEGESEAFIANLDARGM
jgi:hypothetical protein